MGVSPEPPAIMPTCERSWILSRGSFMRGPWNEENKGRRQARIRGKLFPPGNNGKRAHQAHDL